MSTTMKKAVPILIAISLVGNCGESPTDPGARPQAPPSAAVATTLELAPGSLVFQSLGDAEMLVATVRDQNGAVLSDAPVTWASSDPAMASVETGRVTAISNGEVSITATSGSASGSAEVRVEQVAVRLGAAQEEVRLSAIGDTARLSAIAYDANDHEVAGTDVRWSSPDSAVATVSDDGLVTAVSNGTVEILATSGEATVAVTVTVEQVAASLVPDVESVMLTALRDTARISVQAFDSRGAPVENAAVTWLSSDSTVAAVDSTGLVTAVRSGTAEITAVLDELKTIVPVSVGQETASLVVAPDSLRLAFAGDTARISATALDARGNAIPGAPISWTSGDTSVVTVEPGGLVTAVSEGDAEVAVSVDDFSSKVHVRVRWAVGSLTISPSWLVIVERGDTARLVATARDAQGAEIDAAVTWTSEDPRVATVDSTGLVRSVREGETKVTASVVAVEGGTALEASAHITLRIIHRLHVEPSFIILPETGDTARITATATDRYNRVILGAPIRYRSEDPSLATVDQRGLVTATGNGDTFIRVSSGSKEKVVSVGRKISIAGPVVQFAETAFGEGPEEGGTARFTVVLKAPLTEALTVSYSVHSRDDVADVESDSAHVTFLPGETSADIELEVLDDEVPEPTRDTLVVRLIESPNYRVGLHAADSTLIREGVCDRHETITNSILAWDQFGDDVWLDLDVFDAVDHSKCVDMTPESMAEVMTIFAFGFGDDFFDRTPPAGPVMRQRVEPGESYSSPPRRGPQRRFTRSRIPPDADESEFAEMILVKGDLAELTGLFELYLSGFDLSRSRWQDQLFEGLTSLEHVLLEGDLGHLPSNMFEGINTGSGPCHPVTPVNTFYGGYLGRCSITWVDFSFSTVSSYDPQLFHPLGESIRAIYLSGSMAEHELSPGLFAKNPFLQVVDLSDNGFAELPPALFRHNPDLLDLNLYANALTEIPTHAFPSPSQLEILYLDENLIATLPTDFLANNTRLDSLFLEYNEITELPQGFFEGMGSRLRYVGWDGNPGYDDCLDTDFAHPCSFRLAPQVAADTAAKEIAIEMPTGAPGSIQFRLYVHGGKVHRRGGTESVNMVTIPRGGSRSETLTVSRDSGHTGPVQIRAIGILPEHARRQGVTDVYGLPLVVDDLVAVLFAAGGQPTIPIIVGEFAANLPLLVGSTLTSPFELGLDSYYEAPDMSASLVYDAKLVDPADSGSLQVATSAQGVELTPLKADTVVVRVRATTKLSTQTPQQARDSSAFVEADLTVVGRVADASRLKVEVIDVLGSFSAEVQAAVDWSIKQWGDILQDIPDAFVDGSTILDEEVPPCLEEAFDLFDQIQIDDLVVAMVVTSIDGRGGALANAKVCMEREDGHPAIGRIRVDADDLETMPTSLLRKVMAHEIAHTLGFGTSYAWDGLIESPFGTSDPYLDGDSARVEFDRAGGTAYSGNKVPVQIPIFAGNEFWPHWRENVLGDEFMTPAAGRSGNPFSAITAAAMRDMGYKLQANWATFVDSYKLPFARQPADMADRADKPAGPVIDLSGDVVRGPVLVIGKDGRVIRVRRPRGSR